MSLYPAISSCLVTTPVSAMEKGPGPHVCALSPGGGKNSSTIFLACPSHGLSVMPRQTTIVMIPPGLRLARMLRRPATGFSKNCVPKREKQKSCTGWNGWVYVGCQKGDIADARGARIAPPVFQEAVAAVYRK